ncbi:MAG: phosphate ABC transporter substrate-binding protein [Methanoregulaceae archaeon]|nr:phosphate ABC transporter substrate-binding protein [Methanoregulaceae archaeon]
MVFDRKKLGIAGLVIAVLLVFMVFSTGCVNNTAEKTQTGTIVPTTGPTQVTTTVATQGATAAAGNPQAAQSAAGSKTFKVSGSTTVLPIAQNAADAFMTANPGTNIQVSGGGSGVGVQQIGDKLVDIGMSSRDLTKAEMAKYKDFVVIPVALDGIAVIVNSQNNPVNSLTIAQIRDIYSGKITNWKDVGGKDMTIVVIGRDSASGTRTFFTDTVMNKTNYVKTQFEKNSNGAIQQSVSQTPGAIGYVGLGYIDPSVKALTINVNGTLVEPSTRTVLDKSYPISRSLLMITNGQPTGLVKDYIDYILGPDGQKMVIKEGFVPIP